MALFGGLALFNLIACIPILLSSSVRRLFQQLPTENLAINYVLGMGGLTVLHSAALVAVVVATGGLEGIAVLWGLGLVTAGVGLFAWLTASFALPRWDLWNPAEKEDELDGRIALGIGLIWYMISTGTALFLLMAVMIALFFPG